MSSFKRSITTFPTVSIPSPHGELPIEVNLIAQLGHGAGTQIISKTMQRQQRHKNYIDAHDEPSAKLGGINPEKNDLTSLYTFAVDQRGHPFHRHAGHRIFTAITGSGGAQLRFSFAKDEQLRQNPSAFVEQMHFVNLPPDCLFTVRFGGGTWHQFMPLVTNNLHPAFFAISCHSNELGGLSEPQIKQQVLADQANIPALTQLLPENVQRLLDSNKIFEGVARVDLCLDAPASSLHHRVCGIVRSIAGKLRKFLSNWNTIHGYWAFSTNQISVVKHSHIQDDSLLSRQFLGKVIDHQDHFSVLLRNNQITNLKSTELLTRLLASFVESPSGGVSLLMKMRNVLVKPFGLRTSPLGCPVSSLLSEEKQQTFARQFPVLDERISDDSKQSQVILGADDKHLSFRSCVMVDKLDDGSIRFSLSTRVVCRNLFGRIYLALIERVHLSYVAPKMLSTAIHAMLAKEYLHVSNNVVPI